MPKAKGDDTMQMRLAVSGVLVIAVLHAAAAQQAAEPEPLKERIVALEHLVASLEAQLTTAARVPAASLGALDRGVPLSTRLDQLEQDLNSLAANLQRVERQLETALRQSSQAQRQAEQAERQARDAVSRTR
jgi:hypothetical protein